ncbi:hypothetical protein NST28_15865 [Paenibacillus sp. FSL R10-2791]|uniref:hypothetical protein n=1 Tax=Paenibacillus sp. FSL R10-2791 TaxID=2954695 RepID=UPI0030FD173B
MYYYSITIQFAKADAPKFTDILELIDNAVEVYNVKSLMAANPKQIVEKKLRDDMTLEVILESTQKLQESMASKALRVFSSYLIDDETENNLSSFITGKRLFKMMPSKLEGYVPNNEKEKIVKTSKAEKIIFEMNEPTDDDFEELGIDEKLNRIYRKLVDMERRCDHE